MSVPRITLNDGNQIPVLAFGTGSKFKFEFVGKAIRESGLGREDVWITTKYDGGVVLEEVHSSLQKGLWEEMNKVKDAGLPTLLTSGRSIGVSNFTLDLLQRIVKTGKRVPAVNQIRLHPYNYASWKDVLEFSAKHGIVTEAYGSLA
ncbi:NADP-dependent oxidoreductase domain-containing protein [Multifurca ochricompacta]|uniref:NADP-dependent oxidoreductase domain-containing protein n=1 Tax=Multifurca ochricompacta TaxID=376703 RepID=A0AAD4QJF7_9AGAM|nr:NADP-dependent oxidoreductase domain-containing protein [Multifurca ochricompacta]